MDIRIRIVALLAGLVFLVGCEDAKITSYKVPREQPFEKTKEVRMRAVMVTQGENVWFFKLVGPAAEVNEHLASFDEFVQSVRFPEKGEDITWKLPADGGRGQRSLSAIAPFCSARETPLEVSIFVFGKQQDTDNILPNVNRWRRNDLGLKAITEEELKPITKEIAIEKLPATQIDMIGPGPSGGPPMKP